MLIGLRLIWLLLWKQRKEAGRAYLLALLVSVVLLIAYAVLVASVLRDKSAFSFVLYRSLHMTSGVSPALPVTLLWALISFGCWVHLRRVIFKSELDPKLPNVGQQVLCPSLEAMAKKVSNGIDKPLFDVRETSAAVLMGVALILVCAYWQRLQTFEPGAYNWIVTGLASVAFLMMTLACIRAIHIWRALRLTLEHLERHPVRYAFSRLPRHDAWSPLSQPGVAKRTHNILARSFDTLRALRASGDDPELTPALDRSIQTATEHLQPILASFATRTREPWQNTRTLHDTYNRAAELVASSLENEWAQGTSQTLETAQTKTTQPVYSEDELKRCRSRLLKEEFIALRILAWIRYVLRQIRNLLQFTVVSFVLFVLALHAYPFQSERLIDQLTVGMFLIFGSCVFSVLAQLDRDALLSRITDSTAGRLDRAFYVRLVTYGAVPALAVIASQFPSFGRWLYSTVQPVLEAMR
ncbi:MAG TPA: hypothetical protein VES20_25100 [Bryobacteraceae bacterium]|nr:hypothetical protein [Bryobacteraceae bacterium]